MSYMMQPGIILLREGTDTSQGKGQLISNINACQAVVESIRTTLGPRGMDKLMADGQKVVISNDGATIMKQLDIVHPAAKTLVDISLSQDSEVGDGTTSVVLLAGEILKQVKVFVEDGLHSQIIIRALRQASELAIAELKRIAVETSTDEVSGRQVLEKCAGTALNSKLISGHKALFAPMVVDAISYLDPQLLDIRMVGVKKIAGGSVTDSFLVQGVAFKKTFSYAGFEQMTKKFKDPKILLLNVELELKSEKDNAEIRLTDPDQYQSIVDAEWQIIYEKLDKCVQSGAQIILSKLPIGDLATQYFADRGLFCAGRVPGEDLDRVAKATGGCIQTSVTDIPSELLGTCEVFEERQVGDERFNVFTGCVSARTATIVLRGGAEQFIEESHRSIHDALMIVKRTMKSRGIVAGGGAVEMELSKYLTERSREISGKSQLIMKAFSKALEIIPRQLSENAGFDSTDIVNMLRTKHAETTSSEDPCWYGVDVDVEGIVNTFDSGVWEPSLNKLNSLAAATEAACVILSIDETVRNPKSEQPGAMDRNGIGMQRQGQGAISQGLGGMGMQGMMGRGGRGMRGVRAYKGRAGG